jgi:hypothetical protein
MAWWIVVIPGEYPEGSDAYGPFRSADPADQAADGWNKTHPADDGQAFVLPLNDPKEMK